MYILIYNYIYELKYFTTRIRSWGGNMDINRDDIKHNFLRRVILRLDYNGVIDIKDTLKGLEKKLPELGFVEMSTEFINEAEFELADPNMIESQLSIPLKDLHRMETFKYRNRNKNIVLEVNNLYTALTLNTEDYIEFEKYCEIFVDIISMIKKDNIYLNPTRLGLRKINDCIIKDKNKFGEYFNQAYFSDISKVLSDEGFSSEKINTEFIDTIIHNDIMFNYVRIASGGVLSLQNKEYDVYQVVVDIDGYTHDNSKLIDIIKDEAKLKNELSVINYSLFELYIKVLTDEFVRKLADRNSLWDDILGVNINGRI